MANLKNEYKVDSLYEPLQHLEAIFQTDLENGLSQNSAIKILNERKPNKLKIWVRPPFLKLFVQSILESLHILIWISAISTFFTYTYIYQNLKYQRDPTYENIYVVIVLLTVGLIPTLYSFNNRYKTYPTYKSINSIVPEYARVIRNGKIKIVSATKLVIGDLIELRAGETVPADIQIVNSKNLRIDLSSISSETLPRSRCVDCTGYNAIESQNLAFLSCKVVEGTGRGIVIATGMDTFVGRTASLTESIKHKTCQLIKRFDTVSKILIYTNTIFGTVLFVIFFSFGLEYHVAFYYTYGFVFNIIPAGVPITLVLCVVFTKKMLKNRGCICRRIRAVAILGTLTALCIDKTGTITKNNMIVSNLYYFNKLASHNNIAAKNGYQFKALIHAVCLCLDSSYLQDDSVKKFGNATDAAMIAFLKENFLERYVRRQKFKVFEIPFNSVDKYHILVHTQLLDERYILVMKGAPELVIKFCSTILTKNGEIPLDIEVKLLIKNVYSQLAQNGERVIAFCDCVLPLKDYPKNYKFGDDVDFPPKILRFLGFISLKDPLRAFAKETVASLRKAGIKVMMITGDLPITALAAAREVEIVSKGSETNYDDPLSSDKDDLNDSIIEGNLMSKSAVITGKHLMNMEFSAVVRVIVHVEELVFARVSPQQKLMIVEASQKAGHVVAVFGNNVNDIPALQGSDLGISLNDSGEKIAKDIADILLANDYLMSLTMGLGKARILTENLNKVIFYSITPLTAQILQVIAYSVLGLPMPLSILLIVFINTATNIGPAVSLAFEKPETNLMDGIYKNIKISSMLFIALGHTGLVQAAAGFTTYFYTMAMYGFFPKKLFFSNEIWNSDPLGNYVDSYGQEWTLAERLELELLAQSSFFITIVFMQLCNLFSCRTRVISLFKHDVDNHTTFIGVCATVTVTIVLLYAPACNSALYTRPVTLQSILPSIPFGIFSILFEELRKIIIRNYPSHWLNNAFHYH